ncbi:MAG: hypothetical protein IT249_11230 [Chitinophagaceae bacterium]|nr:hypothetical protein [Chitinophagaceae bacterium]
MKVLIFGTALFLSVFISMFSTAQSVRKKGYIVLNNNDTLHGWIDYRNWEKNPSSISFIKDSLSTDITRYSKYDIQAVEITGFDHYIKAIVEKDIRPVSIPDLLPADENRLITDTTLLRVLVEGSQFDLYEMNDNKLHFFIRKTGEGIKELLYKVSLSENNSSFSTQKIFINQLNAYLPELHNAAALANKINNADYKEKDLARIVTEMNKLGGTVEYSITDQVKKIQTSFFVGAGGGYSNLRFDGTNGIFNNMTYTGSFVPYITAGIEVSMSRNLQAIILRMEAAFSSASYTGARSIASSNSSVKYTVTQTNIAPTVSLLFNFIRKETFKVYAGVGAAWNISSYGKNTYTEITNNATSKEIKDYISYPKTWIAPLFKLGTRLNRKISVEFDGRFLASMTDFAMWSLTPQTFTAQFRYFF